MTVCNILKTISLVENFTVWTLHFLLCEFDWNRFCSVSDTIHYGAFFIYDLSRFSLEHLRKNNFFFILNFISFIIFGVCLGVSSCDNIKKGWLPRCQLWKTILKIYVIILIFFLSRKKTAMNSTKHCTRNILMATSNKSLLHLVESKNVYIGKEQ